jgi:thiamine-phosphate pyrophosphorylase
MASDRDTKAELPVAPRIAEIYAITPDHLASALLLSRSKAMFEAGIRTIQYRRKLTAHKSQLGEAQQLQTLAKAHGASLIINDNLELALEVGAAGVHWGRDDIGGTSVESLAREINRARARAATAGLAKPLLVGVSCYNDFARAKVATDAGADYVAFGSMFPSTTKPHATLATAALISRAKQELGASVVAIGGITRDNATALIHAGVDAIAVITDLFSAADDAAIAERVSAFHKLFQVHSATKTT